MVPENDTPNVTREFVQQTTARTGPTPTHIAFLADIHGNYQALTAVLKDLPETVTDIICLGDIVGIGPQPKDCVTIIESQSDHTIQGEFDEYVTTSENVTHDPLIYESIKYAREQLTDHEKQWLADLPRRDVYQGDILLCHSHPDPSLTGTYIQHGDLDTLVDYCERYDVSIIAFAHTHTQEQFSLEHVTENGQIVFNPGSVGHPRDRNQDAAYALFDLETQELEFRRVPYDVEETAAQVEEAGLPEQITDRILNAE